MPCGLSILDQTLDLCQARSLKAESVKLASNEAGLDARSRAPASLASIEEEDDEWRAGVWKKLGEVNELTGLGVCAVCT